MRKLFERAYYHCWEHARPAMRVMIVLSLSLLFILSLPQAWTRKLARLLNEFAFEYLNHTLLLHVTEMGDAVFCGSLGMLVVAFRPDLFKRVLLVVIVASIMSNVLKGYFNYPRPPAIYGVDTVIGPAHTSRSFPSGHTLTAFIVAGFLWQVFRRFWIRILTLGFAVVIGLSRVLIGVHWITDVFFGAWLGWGAVMLLHVLFPTKFDIDEPPVWLTRMRKKDWFNRLFRWLSRPFSSTGNLIVITLCGILIIASIIDKPSEEISVQVQRMIIGFAWFLVLGFQIYLAIFNRWQKKKSK